MRIHCDVCGVEIMKEEAIALEGDGQTFYVCSAACAENQGFHQPMADPSRGEDASAADDR